jgi:rhodanese-related sulfurtransferase
MFAWLRLPKILHRPKIVFKTYNPVELRDLLRDENSTYVLADVREDNEWASGHITGAIHLPLSRFDQVVKTVPEEKELIFYCHSGIRSNAALRRSRRFGVNAAGHLGGGIVKWRNFGFPITQ